MDRNKFFITVIFLILVSGVSILSRHGNVKGIAAGNLIIYFLDIGQGDATLIRTPAGADVLIDGGPDNTVVYKLGQYLPFFDRTIETIILTHPDSDHLTGLVEVLRRYQVGRIIMTGVTHNLPAYQTFLAEAAQRQIAIELIARPVTIDLGGANFEVFWPREDFNGRRVENTNNTSIAGKLVFASTSAMLIGDLEREEELLTLGLDLDVDLYKAGHHGANNANDAEFVMALTPTDAVISVGADNRYGHPHYRALKNLERTGAAVWRTDRAGDLIFVSDGQTIKKLD